MDHEALCTLSVRKCDQAESRGEVPAEGRGRQDDNLLQHVIRYFLVIKVHLYQIFCSETNQSTCSTDLDLNYGRFEYIFEFTEIFEF